MNPRDPNVRLVEAVVSHLHSLKDEFVFVGGCATGLLITDQARPPVRATTDVDLVTEIATRSDYYALSERLRHLGFAEDSESSVICRWRIANFKVDIMPTDGAVLGFTNTWHPAAVETAAECVLPSGTAIRLISSPLFLATKLEAFHDRGDGDFGVSHDMEDLLTVIDGRPEIIEEVAAVRPDVKEYLSDEFESLLAIQEFTNSINWHLAGDSASQERVPIIIERLRAIAGI